MIYMYELLLPMQVAFRFLCVLAGALSTRHAWRVIVALDLYIYIHAIVSESMGSQFGGPGQKALQAMIFA